MSMSTPRTYRIEVKYEGVWAPAPGESTGWTLSYAQRAIKAGIPTLDGSPAAWEGVRIVDEQTGTIIDEERIDVARCESGEWSGVRCSWRGLAADLVLVEWMPGYLRESHEAAGGSGTYPVNGAVRLHVCPACAEAMLETDGDWCREVQP